MKVLLFTSRDSDELGPGAPALLAVEAFLCDWPPQSTLRLRLARRTKEATEAARRFCEALPLVRRTPAPGYVAVPFGGTIGGAW